MQSRPSGAGHCGLVTRRRRCGFFAGILAASLLALVGCLVAAGSVAAQPGPPPGRGPSAGNPQQRADRELFHELVDNRALIRRSVTERPDGVEAVTESDDPEVAKKIVAHVRSMKRRLEEHRPIHVRDPLFAEIFRHADQIDVEIEETGKGVRVVETSSDPWVVELVRAHAKVVSAFLANGRPEMRRNHAVPARPGS